MSRAVQTSAEPRPRGRLWFGLVAAPAAWAVQGALGWLIEMRTCEAAAASPTMGLRLVIAVLGLAALLIALTGAVIAYRSWRRLSAEPSLSHAQGHARAEFMALGGVLVSAVFAVGILWAWLPPLLVDACLVVR